MRVLVEVATFGKCILDFEDIMEEIFATLMTSKIYCTNVAVDF